MSRGVVDQRLPLGLAQILDAAKATVPQKGPDSVIGVLLEDSVDDELARSSFAQVVERSALDQGVRDVELLTTERGGTGRTAPPCRPWTMITSRIVEE
jgi:hypothetical protein